MNSISQEVYRYVPFDHGNQIRLLRLAECKDANVGIHELNNFNLDSLPPFIALSYTWGDPSPFAKLWFQPGSYLNITQSLDEFLASVPILRRDFDEPIEFFWIDAICINQDNTRERNSQVPLMQEIYQNATMVLVWLGPASEDSSLAASFISTMTTTLAGLDEQTINSTQLLQRRPEIPPGKDSRWLATYRLLCRDWFERIWVQQEVILASSILMACGSDWISWDELTSLVGIIYDYSLQYLFNQVSECLDEPRTFQNRISTVHHMQHARRTWRLSGKPPILDNLNELSSCKASDPRDKIYGLLSISTLAYYPKPDGEHQCEVNVDYSVSVESLYTEFALSSLVSGQSTKILHFAQAMGHRNRLRRLPSWVPDWAVSRGLPGFYDWAADAGYNASGKSQAHFRASAVEREVYVKGIRVDKISMASAIPSRDDFPDPTQQIEAGLQCRKILDWITAVEDLCRGLGTYMNGQTWFEACWRTLTGNMLWDGQPRPPNWDLSECEILKDWLTRGISGSATANASPLCWGEEKLSNFQRFVEDLVSTSSSRTFCTSQDGYMGLFPSGTEPGDIICVLFGHVTPFILRPDPQRLEDGMQRYSLIGECYVHGIMYGEAMADLGRHGEDFLLF